MTPSQPPPRRVPEERVWGVLDVRRSKWLGEDDCLFAVRDESKARATAAMQSSLQNRPYEARPLPESIAPRTAPRRVPEEKAFSIEWSKTFRAPDDLDEMPPTGRPLGHREEDQLRCQLDAARAENAEMRRLLAADELSLVADVLEAECGLSEDDYVMPSALAIERLAIRVRAAAEKAGGR